MLLLFNTLIFCVLTSLERLSTQDTHVIVFVVVVVVFSSFISRTYPVLCAYSIFCRKIRFFAFLGEIFLIFGQ